MASIKNLKAFNFQAWIEENKEKLKPPVGNAQTVLAPADAVSNRLPEASKNRFPAGLAPSATRSQSKFENRATADRVRTGAYIAAEISGSIGIAGRVEN